MTYPRWLNVKLYQRLVQQRAIAGNPMSKTTEKAAIAKLRKMIRTGQNQDKILLEAINGVYRGLETAAKEKKSPKKPETATKIPVLTRKPKNLTVINKNLEAMRNALS